MTLQLTAADSAGSSLLALSGGTAQPFSYSPFGATASRTGAPVATVPGFNGERADPLTGVTHLGNGYRAYSPALRRFTSPDSESPFGVGGINPYAYCSSDPVNQRDPSGHGPLMWLIEGIIWGAAKLGKNLALSEAAAAAVSTTESVIWGVSAAASVSTGIASAATRNSNPEVSAKLGWASFGLGITAAAFGIPKAAGRIRARRAAKKENRLSLASEKEIKGIGRFRRETPLQINGNVTLNYRVFGYDTFEKDTKYLEQFYMPNFNDKGEDIIATHGTDRHHLLVFSSAESDYNAYTPKAFVELFKEWGIDLSARKNPLHLVACFSGSAPGSGGLGDRLAALLGRDVITYGRNEILFPESITAGQLFRREKKLDLLTQVGENSSRPAIINYHKAPKV